MRKILSLLLAIILTVSLVPSQTTQAKEIFKDVPTTHYYYDEIMYLLENDVIVESSLYGLNDIVTREEVAVMVAKAVGLDGTPRATKFSDVPKSNPNSGYIQSAADEGILGGYPDGTFKPKTKVTRGQMAVFIANAFDLPSGDKVFKDVKPGQTGYDQIKKLVSAGITSGYADRTFKPNNNLSRSHISLFLVKAMEYERGLSHEAVLEFPAERYPQTAAHILKAIENGESPVCTIDRAGADENREQSLKGIPTKDGYDRDEWPMAMCEEGGEGADVAYVESSDNRGAGAWVGNQLEDYQNGTRVLIKVVGTVTVQPTPVEPTPQPEPIEPEPQEPEKTYKNCTELREDYPNGVSIGHPAYDKKHDRDGDGKACEK